MQIDLFTFKIDVLINLFIQNIKAILERQMNYLPQRVNSGGNIDQCSLPPETSKSARQPTG